jgi:hypothetical protein
MGELDDLDGWKRRALCTAAAERAAPLFRKLGRSQSAAVFEAGLDAVWAAVEAGSLKGIKGPLLRLPEAKSDDSHLPEYFARIALQILFRAADQASSRDVQKAVDCLESIGSLCDDIDTALTAAPGETFRFDPANPPPPGEVEQHEHRAQVEILELLRAAAAPDAKLLGTLRNRARKQSALYAAVVPRLKKAMRDRRRFTAPPGRAR